MDANQTRSPSKEVSPALVAGQSLYLVVESGAGSWEIEERVVLRVTASKFSLDRPFRGRVNTRGLVYRSRIGKLMFLTPEGALESFRALRQDDLDACLRGQAAARVALAWCEEQRRVVDVDVAGAEPDAGADDVEA